MPRIRQNMDQYARSDFLREIRIRMAALDMRQREFAEASGIPPSTMCKRLKNLDMLSALQIRGIVKAVKPDIMPLLLFLGYDAKDIKKFKEEIQ